MSIYVTLCFMSQHPLNITRQHSTQCYKLVNITTYECTVVLNAPRNVTISCYITAALADSVTLCAGTSRRGRLSVMLMTCDARRAFPPALLP